MVEAKRMLEDADFWNQRYLSFPDYIYGEKPNDFLKTVEVMAHRDSKVLVLCDGEGRNGVWLAERGHRVTTVDFSEAGVAKARQLASRRNVNLDIVCADLVEFLSTAQGEGPWDMVVAIFCQLDQPTWQQVAELLTPRFSNHGQLVIEEFSPAQLMMGTGGPASASNTLTMLQAKQLWPNFKTEVRTLERRIFEGRAHRGLSSVVQLLAHVPPNWQTD